MKNLFKRNKTYYVRLTIDKNMQPYFDSNSFIKSLRTNNQRTAILILKYIIANFEYIKKSFMVLSSKEISLLIDEFKKLNYDDLANRHSYLKIEEIDEYLKELNTPTSTNSKHIEYEYYELLKMLNSDYDLDPMFGFDKENANSFKEYLVKLKINILNDIKNKIQSNIVATPTLIPIASTSIPAIPPISIKEVIKEYLEQKSGVSEAVLNQDKLNLNRFIEWTDLRGFKSVNELKNKDLISFREYRKKISPKSKINTINRVLANLSTFIKYCVKEDYLQKDISQGIRLKLDIKDKIDSKRNIFTDSDIKKIFNNIELIEKTVEKKLERKYQDEYQIIIKLGMYTGARENEICQLLKTDIKKEGDIYYIDINIDNDKKIKNLSSIRKVPIHPALLPELLAYRKTFKRKNLFTINANKFSGDFSRFKTVLGFGSKLVFHSFRNTLQNKLKQQKVQNMIINELAGHSSDKSEDMTALYTEKYDIEILYEEILKVKYT